MSAADATTCIRCQRSPARRIRLCIPCWAIVVHGDPDRLPPFPPLSHLLPPLPESDEVAWEMPR